MKSPQAGATKWQSKFGSSSQDYINGVQQTQKDPTALAAAASGLWQAKVSSAGAKDKFTRKLQSVSKADWQNGAVNVGAQRISAGAQKGAPKYTKFANAFYPHVAAGVAALPPKVTGTVDEGIARASAMIRHNATFKG